MIWTSLFLGIISGMVLAAGSISKLSPSAKSACSELAHTLDGGDGSIVNTPPLSTTSVEINWSQSCIFNSSCIVRAHNAEHVSTALAIIVQHEAKFAVRSGGHSPNPGFAGIADPGVLISLENFLQVTLNEDKSVASIGPGTRWGQVYDTLDPAGLAVVGGRLPYVGTAGLVLGGGFSHFSGEFGMAVDNVRNFEVVLANSSIVDANADENVELFWALKGGGPNFGIVTRFDLNTITVRDIWYSIRAYAVESADHVLDTHAAWQMDGGRDPKATVALVISLDVITLVLVYSEPVQNPPAFAAWDNLSTAAVPVPPTLGTVASLTNTLGGSFELLPQRHDYRGVSSKVDAQLYKDVYAHWLPAALATRERTGANQTFSLQPVPANIAAVGVTNGGNALGIPAVDHQWWTTLIDWNNAVDDDDVCSASFSTTEMWTSLSRERGLDVNYIFMNDASRDQNPLSTQGAENLGKLRSIAGAYDPSGIFQRLQKDGFLLSKA
ncbi:FAD linked oxidase-like protein [Pseudovirgaria hyperparasitica]|uniref:FAD linked oxidase-like protein n=1 Tax=Pseudovirgaria hyperparasitica TaxID=470096 RepID=A0A6A6VU24_9PEZI|nr:FAD linked oxidase-like protein [Pseudovirgaria hyperparasitica]KAF2753655.1 FAD linked oxidase-like protein [Pseudovirgaria hyperparasitica]